MAIDTRLQIVMVSLMVVSPALLFAGEQDQPAQPKPSLLREVITQRLGKDHSGVVIRTDAAGSWELLAVGQGDIEVQNGAARSVACSNAELAAKALAQVALAEFVAGSDIHARETLERSSVISSDPKSRSQFRQFMSSRQNVKTEAFLRGLRQIDRWEAEDGHGVLVVVAVNSEDVSRSAEIAAQITQQPDAVNRVIVVKEEGRGGGESAPEEAGATLVRSLGTAPLEKSAPEKARRAALFDALQLAVERVAGMRLTSNTWVQNRDKVHANIHTAAAGSVKKFTVLQEQEKDGQWNVLVEAEIQPNFASCLELIKLFLNDPAISVAGPAESALLKREVVPVVHDVRACLQRASIRVTEDHGPANEVADGFSRAAADHATVLVWCDASSRTAQAYCVATHQPIGQKLVQTWMPDLKSDHRCALADADAARLIDGICLHWNDVIFNGTGLRVVLLNITDLRRQTRAFRQAVQDAAGFRSIEQLSGDATTGQAVFSIRASGTNDAFIDALFDEIDLPRNEQLKSLKLQKQEGDCVYLAFH